MENELETLICPEAGLAEVSEALALNEVTARYGLALSPEAAARIIGRRGTALTETGRVGFRTGLIKKLVLAFCDSPYLEQADYEDTLSSLVEAFYYLKSESGEALADDELLAFMREEFDSSGGSLETMLSALPGELIPSRPLSEEYETHR